MKPISWTTLVLVVCVCSSVSGHSGRTDSNGGHHDRRTGEYHYHSGGPSLSRTTSRSEPPTEARTTARTTSRTSPPSVRRLTADIDDAHPALKGSEYDVVSNELVKTRPKVVIQLLVPDQAHWTDQRLEGIAKDVAIKGRAVFYFYLPDMELEERPWATVVQDTRGALKTSKFD